MTTLSKTFDPASAEARLYAAWEASGAFSPDGVLARDPGAEPFCMVIPPPNVTGSLHMGHALDMTMQDVLARYHRMRGEAVLWLPGTDHAGIATQMVVERQLAAEGNIGRRDMGRDAFVERVWDWKAQSGGTITRQLRRLGASCDWSRERFTLDEGLSAAVRRVFVALHREGLLYRDKRLVNWDPALQTAISDLEVETREESGQMWSFAYPLEGEPIDGVSEIVIATTRPETMLGDGAVAVHPDDARYAKFVGRYVHLPIADRLIPIIADEYPDPEKGSGAVKITGAHDFNDYAVARRHDLSLISIMDGQARMTGPIPQRYQGLDRYAARKLVLEEIEALGLYRGAEERVIARPYGDRSGVVIEPYLTDQWYVDAATLAKPAIAAVEQGRTTFEPANWSKTYFEWMRNIEPWCVSRQLWWGHRIPAWYGPCLAQSLGEQFLEEQQATLDLIKANSGAEPAGDLRAALMWDRSQPKVFVAENEADAIALAETYYGRSVRIAADDEDIYSEDAFNSSAEPAMPIPIARDSDVLDTWFSSALWPFSTLGWPEVTEDLKRFYPTATLVTGFDIIFFWVARMMMMGMHFMDGEVPFRRVVMHGLVRDETGAKMSKSKGNVIDPLEIVDDLGCDALRFSLAILSGTRDIKLSKSRIEGYRNFGTKLWNAARFCQMNGCARTPGFDPAAATHPVNRWLRGEVVKAAAEVTAALDAARFDEAAQALYRFIWNTLCDWHLEFAKPLLNGDDVAARDETRAMTAWALDQAMLLLHPVSPFLTEELWAQTAGETPRDTLLISAPWPELPAAWIDAEASAALDLVIRTVAEGRSLRSELNVPPGARPELVVVDAEPAARAALEANAALVASTLRVSGLSFGAAPAGAAPLRGRGRGLRPAGRRRDRPPGRARAFGQGDRRAAVGRRARRTQARQRRLHRPRQAGGGGGDARQAGRGAGRPGAAARGPAAAGGDGLNPAARPGSAASMNGVYNRAAAVFP